MPITNNSYFRNFLIFEKEDPGYGNGAEPTGYIKLEGREGKGKLLASLQNLKEDAGRLTYKLFIIHCNDKMAFTVYVGKIPLNKGRGELKWDYDADNVAGTGIPIFDFNVAVVVVEFNDRENRSLICPLAAYKGEKVGWRGRALQDSYSDSSKVPDNYERSIQNQEDYQNLDSYYEVENMNTENSHEPESNFKGDISDAGFGNVENVSETKNIEKHDTSRINENPSNNQQTQAGGISPCEDCYANKFNNPVNPENDLYQDMDKLRRNFDRHFVIFDPFNSKRRDYKWWKVDNPVNLNNMLFQSNIRSPLLFNPVVMMAHFKFRHLAIGIYSDRSKEREYLVCGVPGVFGIDSRPFGDMCKWIQMEGDTHRYGAFGYWIVFIDPKSGKFLSI